MGRKKTKHVLVSTLSLILKSTASLDFHFASRLFLSALREQSLSPGLGGANPTLGFLSAQSWPFIGRVLGLKTTPIRHQLFKFIHMSGPQSTCSERGL